MKGIQLFKDYAENEGNITILSSLAGIEVGSHNYEMVVRVLCGTTMEFKLERDRLRSENEKLNNENKKYFSKNYELKKKVGQLKLQIEKLELEITSLKESNHGVTNSQKNAINESDIKSKGNVKIGDDVISGNQNVQIVHNYFGGNSSKTLTQYSNLKSQIESLIAEDKTEKATEILLDTPNLEENNRDSILLLSGRVNNLSRQINRGVLSNDEAKIERQKINVAILEILKNLD